MRFWFPRGEPNSMFLKKPLSFSRFFQQAQVFLHQLVQILLNLFKRPRVRAGAKFSAGSNPHAPLTLELECEFYIASNTHDVLQRYQHPPAVRQPRNHPPPAEMGLTAWRDNRTQTFTECEPALPYNCKAGSLRLPAPTQNRDTTPFLLSSPAAPRTAILRPTLT